MGICAAELAGTVLRTLMLPDVAALRQRLVPELPLFGSEVRDGQDILLSGQADAVVFDETGAMGSNRREARRRCPCRKLNPAGG